MSRRRWEQDQQAYSHRRGCHHSCRSGIFPLISLVLGIAAFFMTIVFRVGEVFLHTFLGMLQGSDKSKGRPAQNMNQSDRQNGFNSDGAAKSSTMNRHSGKEEFAAEGRAAYQQPAAETIKKPKEEPKKAETNQSNPAKTEKKHDEKKDSAKEAEKKNEPSGHDHRSKDWYVILFVMTMIPCTVALAMGKLLYAGFIALAGLGLLIISAIIIGLAAGLRKRPVVEEETEEETGQTDDVIEKLIQEAFDKIFEIRKELDRVTNPDIARRIDGICSIGEKIIGEVRTNPENLKLVKKFFYYYLDAFGEIVRKYLRLSSFTEESGEVLALIQETEKSFADIEAIFKELCEKLVQKDMMDLKAEINVIKNCN